MITPQNAALMVIDYQQNQFRTVRSMDSDLLLENVVSTAKLAKLFGLPIVRFASPLHALGKSPDCRSHARFQDA